MITIDGKEYEFKQGQTVLAAAEEAGVYIPTLCAHESLPPFGACRLCLVKIERMRGYPPACTTPVADGMIITTVDEELQSLRRGVLGLILSEHPNSCVMCSDKELCEKYHACPTKAGRITGCATCPNKEICELRDIIEYLEIEKIDLPFVYKDIPTEREDPFFDRDYNLCILCGRCVRVCQEIRGAGAIAFTMRGNDAKVGTAFGKTHMDTTCMFCGACVDVCPTGALSARGMKWFGKEENSTASTCTICGIGCGMNFKGKWNRMVSSVPDPESEVTKGQACVMGRFCIPPLFNAQGRLKYPLVRKNGVLAPTSWEDALLAAAEGLKRYAPENIMLAASKDLTNEAAYLLNRIGKESLPGAHFDIDSNLGKLVLGEMKKVFGTKLPAAPISRIDTSDNVIIIGAKPHITHNVLMVNLKKAADAGGKIFSMGAWETNDDPMVTRHIFTADYSRSLLSILGAISRKNDEMAGMRELRDSLEEYPMDDDILALTDALFSGVKTTIIVGGDILGDNSEVVLTAIIDILKITGNEEGLLPLFQGNTRGVMDSIGDCEAAEDIKAVYSTTGSMDIPENTEFLVLQDVFESPMMDRADVVLPALGFVEDSGTVTSIEGRVSWIRPIAKPAGKAMADREIFSMLAGILGNHDLDYKNADEVTREMVGKKIMAEPGSRSGNAGIPRLIPITHNGNAIKNKDRSFGYRGAFIPDKVPDLDVLFRSRGVIE